MSRYIDADALIKECERKIKADNERRMAMVDTDFIDLVNDAYTEDVVEVVRCKNCVHWDRENVELHTRSRDDSTLAEFAECYCWSNWSTCRKTRFDDYCSCCERIGENNEG